MPLKFNPTTGKLDLVNTSSGGGIDPDTEATLLASSPTASGYVIATDTLRGLYYDADNTQWYIASIPLSTDNANPDAGAVEGADKQGYNKNIIIYKMLIDIFLGGNSHEVDGAIRLDWSQDPPVFQIYFNGQWNNYFVFDTSTGILKYDFQNDTYTAYSGNGSLVGANGIATTQQNKATAGANGTPIVINGNGV